MSGSRVESQESRTKRQETRNKVRETRKKKKETKISNVTLNIVYSEPVELSKCQENKKNKTKKQQYEIISGRHCSL